MQSGLGHHITIEGERTQDMHDIVVYLESAACVMDTIALFEAQAIQDNGDTSGHCVSILAKRG